MKRSVVGLLVLICLSFCLRAATTISPINHFAYASNLGWVDWRGNLSSGSAIGDYLCSGYLYAANVGWINLGSGLPRNGIRYSNLSAGDFGVNHDSAGNLQGYAWGANIGWLTFTNRDAAGALYDGPRIDPITGQLSGWIWGANVGWISLGNTVAFVQVDRLLPGADADHDGLPDAWELDHLGNLTTADALSDQDGDGLGDLEEYLAGTDPKQAASSLRVTLAPSLAGPSLVFTWSSQPSCQYRILQANRLIPPLSWSDVGLGWINPDPGGTTRRQLNKNGAASGYYRLEAVKPLGP
jgi:hypothetical protein